MKENKKLYDIEHLMAYKRKDGKRNRKSMFVLKDDHSFVKEDPRPVK